MWLFGRVHHLVWFQAECVDDSFTNHLKTSGITFIKFHVNLHVTSEACLNGKALPAVDANVWVGGFMDFEMFVEIRHAPKNLTAFTALQALGFVNNNAVL